jgi:hypothetical protein
MKLTPLERESAAWKRMEGEIKERLQVFRERNDGNLSAQETDRIRGQIALCKEILAWGQDDPEIK